MRKLLTQHAHKFFWSYLFLILLLTLLPLNGGSKINNIFIVDIRADYLIHVALYLPIGFLVRANFQNNRWSSFKFLLVSGIGSLAFASGMEYAQFFTTWRSFNINDLIANNIGVALSYALLLAFK